MCGIVAYVGNKQCQNLMLEGLRRLEYRGYDSSAAVAALPPQSASTLAVQRGAQTLELPVVVAERPPLRSQGDR